MNPYWLEVSQRDLEEKSIRLATELHLLRAHDYDVVATLM
jgi:hypothetical protein